MQRYARDFGDRYGEGLSRGRGPRRSFQSAPQPIYDEIFVPRGGHGAYGGHGAGRYAFQEGRPWNQGWGYDDPFGEIPRNPAPPRRGGWQDGPDREPAGAADTVRAADLMTRNPEAVTPETPLLEVARRMRDLDVGVMPVVDDADSFHLRGIVTDRDIAIRAAAEGKDMKKTQVREIMSSTLHTVGENDHVRDVFTIMKRARVRRVPVTAADGRLVGIIAQADLAVNYAGLDLQRETEVEEVIERISEPARPRWGRESASADPRGRMLGRFRPDFDADLPDRVRAGWRSFRREARDLMGRGRDGSRGYDRGWR